jgi:hypothetical protein
LVKVQLERDLAAQRPETIVHATNKFPLKGLTPKKQSRESIRNNPVLDGLKG